MTATTRQSKPVRPKRRLIERPRLTKRLDESEARVILLLAPAGYGKTTLARQWAKGLSGTVWVTLTPAHRDVARFAEDLASGIDSLGGNASRFVGEYLRARGNPQRAARDLGATLAELLDGVRAQWVVLDDFHEVSESPELNELISVIEARSAVRLLVASRRRPAWTSQRRVLYREVEQLDRDDLAMDEGESKLVLGQRPDLEGLANQAEGWPAVLALAAGTGRLRLPGGAMPAELYAFIAEELFQSVPETLRGQLVQLALTPEMSPDEVTDLLGEDGIHVIQEAREIGFLSSDQHIDFHPLVREFLLEKLSETTHAGQAVRSAVTTCVERRNWDRAFELILRFELADLVEPVLDSAYKPLARSGHLATLLTFARSARELFSSTRCPAILDLVDAEVASRDGAYQLAHDLAAQVGSRFPANHALASRAHAIVAHCAFSQADLERAEGAYGRAHETATDDRDRTDALYGQVLASIQGEVGDPAPILRRLARRRDKSALDLVRWGTVRATHRRFGKGFAEPLRVEESLHALGRLDDPRARSSLRATYAYVLTLMGEYREAVNPAYQAQADVDAFGLEFARPYVNTILTLSYMGLRRFGTAERTLQLLEDATTHHGIGINILNAKMLRIRMALQTGEFDRAVELAARPATEVAVPAILGEYLATQALTYAATGHLGRVAASASAALQQTRAVEVRVLALAARAVGAEERHRERECRALFDCAQALRTWDPVVTALRCSPELSDTAARVPELRPALEQLYARSNDFALARRAGIRARSHRLPHELLTPREQEVIGLIARGFRNREIANALVISESTTKVHVRHVLEKLGVRTRAEAITRFDLFSAQTDERRVG